MSEKYNGPSEYEPIGAWGYFGWSLLFSIPFVGFILLIVFSTKAAHNVNLRNFARSHFCSIALIGIICLIILICVGSIGGFVDLFETLAYELGF